MRDRRIDIYLAAIETRLTLHRGHDEQLTRELRCHIRQQLQDLLEEGKSPAEAVRILFEELGRPDEIVNDYQRLDHRRRWIMRTMSVTAAAAVLIVVSMFLVPMSGPVGPLPAASWATTGANAAAPVMAAHWLQSALPITIHAAANGVPAQVNHQGVVSVNSVRFTGTGQFRFALVSTSSGLNVWTNDGSNLNGTGSPGSAVALPVLDGVYNVRLGEQPHMVALDPGLFAQDDLKLRVWFDDAIHGPQLLSPDQNLSTSPYAFMAANVSDGAITAAKISADFDGWIGASETWSYENATGFTVPGDVLARYPKGTRIRMTQDGIDKYFAVIGGHFDTMSHVYITAGTSYTFTASPISNPRFSYYATPRGYPQWFNYSPTFTGAGGMTFTLQALSHARFTIQGQACLVNVRVDSAATSGSAANIILCTMPVPAAFTTYFQGSGVAGHYQSPGMAVITDSGAYNQVRIQRYDFGNHQLVGSGFILQLNAQYEF